MSIWLLILLATAIQATVPFHWEFDLKQCSYNNYNKGYTNVIYQRRNSTRKKLRKVENSDRGKFLAMNSNVRTIATKSKSQMIKIGGGTMRRLNAKTESIKSVTADFHMKSSGISKAMKL
ncbi:hypothetical protein PENTCL1PPCAC_11870 [Pristionchus entomophagus]|uniref:Uncharacterized protein n=1 Tax=Pristionchus entomophagus TaxID=358040 RepID=A0AAV5T3P4_9BILA|nr:hypothetical protein PENTCL1PPCAC_11870 [Pristionchus entomophagus]